MKDIQMIRLMDMIRKSIQRNRSLTVSQISKVISKDEDAKAITDSHKALSIKHIGLAITPKQAVALIVLACTPPSPCWGYISKMLAPTPT